MKHEYKKFQKISEFLEKNEYFQVEQDLELIEDCKRTFVSRLYYSAFHCSINFANRLSPYLSKNLQFIYQANTAHGDIRGFYSKLSIRYTKKDIQEIFGDISEKLEELHEYRKFCDYQEHVKRLDTVCFKSKNISQNIYYKLNQLHDLVDSIEKP